MSNTGFLATAPSPSAVGQLIAFPYAGAGTAIYHRWRAQLLPDIELRPVLLPGRETRLNDRPYLQLADLVADLVAELIVAIDRPYALLGHSMGGLVAFEVCRELRRRQQRLPELLVLSAVRAAHCRLSSAIHELDDDQFLEALVDRYAAIPDEVLRQEQYMQRVLPTLRADIRLLETAQYVAEEPLPVNLLVLGGMGDTTIPVGDLQAWREHTSRGFALKLLPGGHFFLFESNSEKAAMALVNRQLSGVFPTGSQDKLGTDG